MLGNKYRHTYVLESFEYLRHMGLRFEYNRALVKTDRTK